MPTPLLHRTTHRFLQAVDRAVLEHVLTPSAASLEPIESLTHPERMAALAAFAAFYERPEHYASATEFFSRLERIRPRELPLRSYRGAGEVIDLSWQSQFEPMWSPAVAAARFGQVLARLRAAGDLRACTQLADSLRALERAERRLGIQACYGASAPENSTMYARWFRHAGAARPCAVILHGYVGGRLAVEEHLWPVHALFDSGLDVVLTVLPLHGVRAGSRRRFRLPAFPSGDPRLAIEGFRHLVHDHLSLFDYLLDGRVSSLGVMGMSLGGYAAALLCTIDARIRFGVFHMPLASIADFASRTGRIVGSELDQRDQVAALDQVYRPVSPLARPSLLTAGRAIVVAGRADAITGVPQGKRLVAHFDAVWSTFAGGHILPLGRGPAFDPIWRMFQQEGIAPAGGG